MNGLGDIHYKGVDPLETYFDILRQGIRLPRRKWIVKPEWEPCEVQVRPRPGESKDIDQAQKIIRGFQDFLECHALPRQWQLLTDFWTRLQCGTYFVKNPNWIEPPVTGIPMEIGTPAAGTPLLALHAGGAFDLVLWATIPDRFIGVINAVGTALESPTAFADVEWRLAIDEKPIPAVDISTVTTLPASVLDSGTYVLPAIPASTPETFSYQLGDPSKPTPLGMPIIVRGGQTVILAARVKGADDHTAFARWQGFLYPAKQITQDGSYADFHTL